MTEPAVPDLSTFFWKVVTNNSPTTLILIVLGMLTWIGGGNILIVRHYRRLGKSRWHGLRPFVFPFGTFNAKEWVTLALLAITSLALFALATAVNGPVSR